MKVSFKNLIINLIHLFYEEHIGFGKTRLIKLAYLVELEYYRRNREQLTDADWIYYKFGPYPNNYNDYLDAKGLSIEEESNGFAVIAPKEFSTPPPMDDNIIRLSRNLMKKFGNMELNKLLDYVYYNTEPMMNVNERMEKLNFAVAFTLDQCKIKPLSLDDKTKKNIQRKYKEKIKNTYAL